MKILLVLLFFTGTVYGQFYKDSSIIKPITDLPTREPFDTTRTYNKMAKPFVYIISDKDMYDLFGYDLSIKYREFDFENYHILGLQKEKEWTWFMRENKKAFNEIPSMTLSGHLKTYLPKDRNSFFGDTIINSTSDPTEALWFTHGHGDCFAKFKFSLFRDNYHPVLIMKEWNYWGGCRAGGSWDFTISFKKTEGILHYNKNIILVEKKYD